MSVDTDILILGGGCSGLSLAVALAEHAPHLRVTTLEKRAAYTRDRTWCFWNTTHHPFQAGVTREWRQWRVRADDKDVRQHSARIRYQHLPADRFYQIALQKLATAKHDLLLNDAVSEIRPEGDGYLVESSRGSIRSRWLFDARTPAPTASEPILWQRFLGWHVQTDRPCFDPEVVDLMDFQASANDGRTVFFYMLPFGSNEALLEVTYLDAAHLPAEDGVERMRAHMYTLCPEGAYRVLYEEMGALPMGQQRPSALRQSVGVPIGTRGGRVKPSSGYAFQRIQRQSQMIAKALGASRPLPTTFEPRIYSALDHVFLAALQRRPQQAASYFLELFRRVPPEMLIPFLSETANARAILTAMLALPKRHFVEAALVSLRAASA